MPFNDRDKLNRIEELKGKLFSKNYETKIEHRDNFTHRENRDVMDSWGVREGSQTDTLNYADRFFMKTPIFKNFFIFSVVFFILTLGYASYVFFGGGNTVSNDNIDISIIGNAFTGGGEELSLTVGIANRNNSPLELADLVMEYPKSSSNSSNPSGNQPPMHTRLSLGTIPAGSVRNENLKVVLFGEQGSVRAIKISLEYRVEGSNAIFVKEKGYDVSISSTPLNLSVDAPNTISPNQDIALNVKATLNATRTISKVLLKIDYPAGFQFKSAVPAPSFGNNIWVLGDLAPGGDRNISISGKMVDVFDGEEKTFRISSGSQSASDKSMIDVVFNSIGQTVMVKRPFIEANLFVNGAFQKEYAIDTKTKMEGEIRYANNLDTQVGDLVIRAKISGNAVNRKTISAERGFYNSSQDVISWDKNSISDFAQINPGGSGSVRFSISPMPLFSAEGGLLGSPSIDIQVSISGKQPVEGYATEQINNSSSAIVKIISDVGIVAKGLYYSGPFKNFGLIPPKVEKETSYTISWSLSNTANNISKAVARSTLPPWARYLGHISPSEEDLTYNSSTKELVWNVGAIGKGAGITAGSRAVFFQIALTPSLSQVGTAPTIINDAVLTGHDDFANVDVKVTKTSLITQLNNDPLFPGGGGVVVE